MRFFKKRVKEEPQVEKKGIEEGYLDYKIVVSFNEAQEYIVGLEWPSNNKTKSIENLFCTLSLLTKGDLDQVIKESLMSIAEKSEDEDTKSIAAHVYYLFSEESDKNKSNQPLIPPVLAFNAAFLSNKND